ncbi:MFS transporter [Georgenia sp. H159]|uniref:MFS transporter n=1 Tax=Georgenia sp. H159 TaxID=3076115 RepID=UPI002D7A3F62|nr:MFS transporter [Georgenia sp. H159]
MAAHTDDALPTQSLTRAERLDRLPFTRAHGKLLGGSGVGWALDAMDVGLISFVIAALAQAWDLSAAEQSWIASVGFVGMAIGASVGGLLADRIGRRQVFALTLLIYGLATGASALATGLVMLIVLRFLVGLGLGAELPVASTLVSEYAPKRIRGRVVVILEAFWALGWIAAALIGYFVVDAENGWRWAFVIGMVPAVYAIYVRMRLPESVRFLERTGRADQAEAAVRVYEESAGQRPVPSPAIAEEPAAPPHWRELWTARFRRRTAALWVVWFGVNFAYYGAFIWLPSLLVSQGFSLVKSFEYTLIITLAQLPGYAVAAFLIEKWGRRATLATFLAGSAVAAVLFGQATTVPQIIAAGMALSAFNLGAWGALYAVSPEIYPTALRGTGSGSAAAFGRLASIIAPLAVPFFIASGGSSLAFVAFGIAFVVAMVGSLFLPEFRGAALEET